MLTVMFPVFEIDGEEYVADTSLVLTSSPPQYNAYRIKDKQHRFVYCSQTGDTKRYMNSYDFHEWKHGKAIGVTTSTGPNYGSVTWHNDPDAVVEPKVQTVEPTPLEKLEARVTALEELLNKEHS